MPPRNPAQPTVDARRTSRFFGDWRAAWVCCRSRLSGCPVSKNLSLEARLLAVLAVGGCSWGAATPEPELDPADVIPAPTPQPPADDAPPPTPVEAGTLVVTSAPEAFGPVQISVEQSQPRELWLVSGTEAGLGLVGDVEVQVRNPRVAAVAEPVTTGGAHTLSLTGLHQQMVPEGESILLQVVSSDGSFTTPPVSAVVVPFERTCGDSVMALAYTGGDSRLVACSLDLVPGLCPEPFQVGDAATILTAAGAALDASAQVGPGCLETQAEAACCYSYEVTTATGDSGWGGSGWQGRDSGGWGGGGGWVGRPFRVAGEARAADLTAGAPTETPGGPAAIRARLADEWMKAAQEEHASVAAFARFSLELLQLGAPLELVQAATQAQLDEVRHAEDALRLARRFGAPVEGFGTLPLAGAMDGRDLRTVTLDVVREGCINETVGVLLAMSARDAAVDPEVKQALTTVVDDETRHAELAWRFVRWALSQPAAAGGGDALKQDVLALLDGFSAAGGTPSRDPDADALRGWGVVDAVEQRRVAVRAERLLEACAKALA